MVNQEIKEGLKRSLEMGESLRSAMISFYNSGYSKQDIEEAAKSLQMEKQEEQRRMQLVQQFPQGQGISQPQPAEPGALLRPGMSQRPVQKISDYTPTPPDDNKRKKIIILVIILLLLTGLLISLFLFKQEITDFFGKLFS